MAEAGDTAAEVRLTRPVWYKSLHWRLLGGYAALVIPVLAMLIVLINHQLQRYLLDRTQSTLAMEADLIAKAIESTRDPQGSWDHFTDALAGSRPLSSEQGLRVTLIDAQGRVLGDSELSGPALAGMDRHHTRPEVAEALQSGQGVSVRYSRTLDKPLIYVTHRISEEIEGPRVLRLAQDRDSNQGILTRIQTLLWLAALATLLTVLLAGFITSRVISRPIAEISAASRRVARGGRPEHIEDDRDDELGLLAASINDLSVELTSRLSQTQADKALLSTILDGMTEGVLVGDREGRAVLVNPVASELLDLGEDVLGRTLLELHRSPALKDAMDEVQARDRAIHQELVLRRADTLHLSVAVAPLRQGDEIRGAVAVLHDITTLRKLERVRRDFVANVSHELRTPLATITGYAETLLSGAVELDPVAREFTETIDRHIKRLNALVEDLLILARIEADGEQPRLGVVSMREVLAEVIDAVGPRAEKHNIAIKVDVKAATHVVAESRALTQVLRNLVENGIHYSNPGGRVRVSTRRDGQRVTISVADAGIGIEPQHLPRIFERFYRVDPGRSREVGGTGLGLAIVKHMVQAMDGEIDVESTPGKGSVFMISLQAVEPRDDHPSGAAHRPRAEHLG